MKKLYILRIGETDIFRPKVGITENEFKRIVDSSSNLTWLENTEHGKIWDKESPVLRNEVAYLNYRFEDEKSYIHIERTSQGVIQVQFDYRLDDKSLVDLIDIAESIKCNLWQYNPKRIITRDYLEELQLAGAKRGELEDPVVEYTFGELEPWIALKEKERNKVLKHLNVEIEKELLWDESFEGLDECQVAITPSIGGWIFVVGRQLYQAIPETSKNIEDKTEKFMQSLVDFSKSFKELHWYEFSEKYNIDVFIQIKKGKEVYRSMYFDGNLDEQGDRPKQLLGEQRVHAIEAAELLSINPSRLRYYKGIDKAKVKVGALD